MVLGHKSITVTVQLGSREKQKRQFGLQSHWNGEKGAEKALNGKLFALTASSWRFSILL
jgi:hypothetical protein